MAFVRPAGGSTARNAAIAIVLAVMAGAIAYLWVDEVFFLESNPLRSSGAAGRGGLTLLQSSWCPTVPQVGLHASLLTGKTNALADQSIASIIYKMTSSASLVRSSRST